MAKIIGVKFKGGGKVLFILLASFGSLLLIPLQPRRICGGVSVPFY